jgi:hypothetical protein
VILSPWTRWRNFGHDRTVLLRVRVLSSLRRVQPRRGRLVLPGDDIVLEITDWDLHFENNRTRGMKHLRWVPTPNKHDGEGYTILMTEDPNGPEDYAAWNLIVQVASKCEPRGKLVKGDGTAMDAQCLARKTRAPARIFEHAIPRLLVIGWLRDTDEGAGFPQGGAVKAQDGAAEQNRREGNRREEKRREGKRREGKGKAKQKRKPKETYHPPKAVTDIAAAIGVDVGLVVRLVQQGYEEHRLLAWMLKMADGTVKANNPPAYLTAVLKEGKHPREDYVAEAKALLEPPVPDLGFSAALPEVPRETSMNAKKNAALEALRDARRQPEAG